MKDNMCMTDYNIFMCYIVEPDESEGFKKMRTQFVKQMKMIIPM